MGTSNEPFYYQVYVEDEGETKPYCIRFKCYDVTTREIIEQMFIEHSGSNSYRDIRQDIY